MFIIVPILLPVIAVIAIMISPLWCITQGTIWERQTNKRRLLLFLGSSFLVSAGISGALYMFGTLKIWDKEVWNYKIVGIQHEEKWTTEESRTETYTTGSGEDQQTHTRIVYYTETHGPYWTATDEYCSAFPIEQAEYDRWKSVWANEQKTGVHKGSAAGFTTPITGGIFGCHWSGEFNKIYPWSAIHHYKNKVRYSHSVLKYAAPTKVLVKKYPRPADLNETSPVLVYGKTFTDSERLLLRQTNAELGPKYRVHPILVAFGPDVSRAAVSEVLSAWRGPNKNELVTFAAFKDDVVLWCEVHSWMDNTTLHASLRNELMNGNFTAKKYSDLLLKYVPMQWHKKSFKDFEYLRVEIHWGWKVGSLLLSVFSLFGLFLLVDNKVGDPWRGF